LHIEEFKKNFGNYTTLFRFLYFFLLVLQKLKK